jgi:hypothetical protein
MSWFWKAKEEPCGSIANALGNFKKQQDIDGLQKELDSIKGEQKRLHEKVYGDRKFLIHGTVWSGLGAYHATEEFARYDGEYNGITIDNRQLSNEDAIRLAEFILDNLKEDK